MNRYWEIGMRSGSAKGVNRLEADREGVIELYVAQLCSALC